jgi:hypothetical protein
MRYRKMAGLFVVVLGYMFIGAASVSAQVTTSTRPVFTFQDDAGNLLDTQTEVPFSDSELVRTNEDSVCISVDTNSLPPGAYTAWWIVFNNPENCENPAPVGRARCGEPDLFFAEPNGAALWANGGIVGPDGEAHFSACLTPGEAPGFVVFGPGLVNVQGAEIHYVIKNHGPVPADDPLLLGQLLTTLSGTEPTCDPTKELPFQCPDPQLVIHSPGSPFHSLDCNEDGVVNGADLVGYGC